MKFIPFLLLACTLSLQAQIMGPGIKPNTPQLPGQPWVVHDGTRPQPIRVETAGAVTIPAPSDALILFDGSSNRQWETLKNGEAWPINDGILRADKRGTIQTKTHFGDCQLHIEWRIPAGRKVKSQKGGNSGVFLPGGHEIQILQSFDNPTYPDGQAGALYGQYPPLVNASSPQGTWQSFDIFFETVRVDEEGKLNEPAKVTVIHNGVLVHNRRAFLGPTRWRSLPQYPAKPKPTGPIQLQWHGDPIEFRNIWLRKLDKN